MKHLLVLSKLILLSASILFISNTISAQEVTEDGNTITIRGYDSDSLKSKETVKCVIEFITSRAGEEVKVTTFADSGWEALHFLIDLILALVDADRKIVAGDRDTAKIIEPSGDKDYPGKCEFYITVEVSKD